ncbi:MAG: hypothetical protein LLG01_18770 [Planctomycetaceae bacterium]|nr:hypothetical protein [Planctomycetaceae bacterium]
MTSLQRMKAAIAGQPFDRYPFINPYPDFSLMPYWPEMLGLTWLHVQFGSDAQRLACFRAMHEQVGLDWLMAGCGPCGQDSRYSIRVDDGVPVLIELASGTETPFPEFWKDEPITEQRYRSVADVEAEPAPQTVEELLAGGNFDFTRLLAQELGDSVFLYGNVGGAFSNTYRALTFEGIYEAILDNPSLVHAIAQRATAGTIAWIKAFARCGMHAVRINEYPCGAELLSDAHFRTFVLPYLKQMVDAIHDAGMIAVQEYLGWVGPRLKHLAALGIDCLETESSMKNYRNDIGEIRSIIGEGVCLFSNSQILQVIEQGSEELWRADAAEQARGIGKQRRFAICAGSPTTWATTPQRLKRYGEVVGQTLAKIVPPLG